jgi:hypothetical protein
VSQRRRLKFADVDAVAAEVGRLRKGYTRAGNWSLPQACRHLQWAMQYSMKPAPERKNVETTRFQWVLLKIILASGKIPAGVQTPERIVPTEDTPEAAIDEFLAALEELKNFTGEFSPHPLLGPIKRRDYVRLHLIHCAHHLGFLSPVE